MKAFFKTLDSFSRKLYDDNLNAISAHVSFYILISFFPFAMFLLTLLHYLPIPLDSIYSISAQIFPSAINDYIKTLLVELSASASGTILSVTVVLSLWSASRGFLALMRGMNRIYSIKESRNYFIIRIFSALYTLTFAVILLIFLVIFVFGNQLTIWFLARFPVIGSYALFVKSVRTVVGIAILLFFFLLIYVKIPNRKSNIIKELPGAILASFGWVGFSFLYSFYIDNMSNYTATYGSLTAIVLCMLWLYACMYIVLIGAEINSVLANPVINEAIRRHFHFRKMVKKLDNLPQEEDTVTPNK